MRSKKSANNEVEGTTHLAVDSSVWISALRAQEPRHAESLACVEGIARGLHEVSLPVSVPVEVASAVHRRTGDPALARRVGTDIAREPRVRIQVQGIEDLDRLLRLASISGLRGGDVLLLDVAVEAGAILVTLDEELLEGSRPFADAARPGEID